MRAIGGYLGLELEAGTEYHENAIRLNTGRNALEYILRASGYKKLYVPFFTCHVMLQPVTRLGIAYEYYHIDEKLEPVFDYNGLKDDEAFLYTNYFGLKGPFISTLATKLPHLIVDNVQAFFEMPVPGTHTLYSARKFFGVPDGAYLYTDKKLEVPLEQDYSYDRCAHLLKRVDMSAEAGYAAFSENDKALDEVPMKSMSRLTEKMLQAIDYKGSAFKRQSNYNYLHQILGERNQLPVEMLPGDQVPMVYPFLCENGDLLRENLISNRIYVARYWPEVLSLVDVQAVEYTYTRDLVHLPISADLSIADLETITTTIKQANI